MRLINGTASASQPLLFDHPPAVAGRPPGPRPCARGKFLFAGGEKLYVRGVTYGTFRPDANGHEFPAPDVVERDFALMAANGLNAVRTYTVPPRSLLDAARDHGLRVMVGLPVERSVAFLDYRKCARSIEALVRDGVRACAGHPAVLCYTIGNEIPAPLVRWHGRRTVERFLERLYRTAKTEDPDGLVTYVNYPSTEYLQLPFLDLACFNVYLETQDRLDAYLARLQNLTGDRPLVMGEVGLDGLRNGEGRQAQVLGWQVRTTFAAGCAGAFVYAWTDEWFRGGAEVEDWEFGLTRRDRRPKPALAAVREAFQAAPYRPDEAWPRVSVVVCSRNGARTLRECLGGLKALAYPDYEVIVVDDGSTDATPAIAAAFDVRLVSTENRGLSNARNLGLELATGDIVAYIDDDAYPDPHWLHYLAATLRGTTHAAAGGPNVPPPGTGAVAECVAHAPGGPVHVLLTDRVAEHIPGCNMAFWKDALKAIGGFDPQLRVAGDDVDVCWRLQQRGWTIGFSPAAVVWHHRRHTVRGYWKQQRGYGKAEALLEQKWPEKYNAAGHHTWSGRVYGNGHAHRLGWGGRIYHGIWGRAPFQSLYERAPGVWGALPAMPEWYLIVGALAVLSGLGAAWPPLLWAVPLLACAVGAPVAAAARAAAAAPLAGAPRSRLGRWKVRLVIAGLHLLQPLARLSGRLHNGLTVWRRRSRPGLALLRPRTETAWCTRSHSPDDRLRAVEVALRAQGEVPVRGGEFDRWDLEVRGGLLGSARLLLAVDYHGDGRQLLRTRTWPRCATAGLLTTAALAALAVAAGRDGAWEACVSLGVAAAWLAGRMLWECATATAALLRGIRQPGSGEE
jgi:GT2 family glycosyltransferase